MRSILAASLFLAGCATAPDPALDADPLNLSIEIGRYSALLGQVVEHTGVSYEHTALGDAASGDEVTTASLSVALREAAADYNAVRRALCASRGAAAFDAIRDASCRAPAAKLWPLDAKDFVTVARRSAETGEPIIALWGAVCDEAQRLQAPSDADEPVCPME